jgi:hypothetical protein
VAHRLFPAAWQPSALTRPEELTGLLAVTVHPESVSRELLATVAIVLAVGAGADETLARFAASAETSLPPPAPARDEGDVLAWLRSEPDALVVFRATPPRAERRRHVRKHATGELGEDESFYFRGPDDRLNLRARSLRTFVELADGVDDDTWVHHLERGDYSRWFRDAIEDDELAAEAEGIERDRALGAAASRQRIREAIERRYTAPA